MKRQSALQIRPNKQVSISNIPTVHLKKKYLPETMGSGGLFFDYNNDGYLDIYLVNSGTLGPASESRRHPNDMNVLYRNQGDGTFVDATVEAGLQQNHGYGMGCLAADYDNDG